MVNFLVLLAELVLLLVCLLLAVLHRLLQFSGPLPLLDEQLLSLFFLVEQLFVEVIDAAAFSFQLFELPAPLLKLELNLGH